MVRLTDELKVFVTVGEEKVIFTLRMPTNKELNDFLASRSRLDRRNRLKDFSTEARTNLFDKLLVGVENLEDKDGVPIKPENVDKIPVNWKVDIIFREFEDTGIDSKNF